MITFFSQRLNHQIIGCVERCHDSIKLLFFKKKGRLNNLYRYDDDELLQLLAGSDISFLH